MKIQPVSICILYKNLTKESVDVFLQKRCENGSLDGLLEFPGGKIETLESPMDAAKRELKEETGLNIAIESFQLFKIHNHEYEDRTVQLYIFIVHDIENRAELEFTTIKIKENVKLLDIPEANKNFLEEFLNFLDEQG